MKKLPIKTLSTGAMIAALYFVLAIVFMPISFGPLQFRVSEALTILPMFTPAAIPGLFLGCLLANIFGSGNVFDIIFGSLTTLAAALLTRQLKGNIWLAMLPPIIFNGLSVGYILAFLYAAPLLLTIGQITLGQAGVLLLLGVPLYYFLRASKIEKFLK
ncbi:MAG: QueT transporter family protein [Clostridia bacterium]